MSYVHTSYSRGHGEKSGVTDAEGIYRQEEAAAREREGKEGRKGTTAASLFLSEEHFKAQHFSSSPASRHVSGFHHDHVVGF